MYTEFNNLQGRKKGKKWTIFYPQYSMKFGGVLKSMLTLNEAIIDVKEG